MRGTHLTGQRVVHTSKANSRVGALADRVKNGDKLVVGNASVGGPVQVAHCVELSIHRSWTPCAEHATRVIRAQLQIKARMHGIR